MLAKIGVIHGGEEAAARSRPRAPTSSAVNLDLMYALPGQTLDMALADLRSRSVSACSTCRATTSLEPNTPFAHDPPALPDDDTAADMQEAIEARPPAAGFTHYETSAFARPHEQSRHNSTTDLRRLPLALGPARARQALQPRGHPPRDAPQTRALPSAGRAATSSRRRARCRWPSRLRVHDERAAAHRRAFGQTVRGRARGCRSRPSPTNWRGRERGSAGHGGWKTAATLQGRRFPNERCRGF